MNFFNTIGEFLLIGSLIYVIFVFINLIYRLFLFFELNQENVNFKLTTKESVILWITLTIIFTHLF